MNTLFLLAAQYNKTLIPLDEICETYFGMDRKAAYQAAAANSLPVPVIRMRDSQKCPWVVHIGELAALIDTRVKMARVEWEKARVTHGR